MFSEMVLTMIEELYIRLDDLYSQLLVGKLRGEITTRSCPVNIRIGDWENPRGALEGLFLDNRLQRIRLTYRGLRRINELRELLSRDRVMEPFGVLLSMQYFRRDLQVALATSTHVAVSVLYVDMDHFKPINTKFGQSAGDVVMKSYLEVVRESVGMFGTGYRGVGDEVAVLIRGQGHERACDFSEQIRKGVESMKCKYEGCELPRVTASIGLASSPPEDRNMELETLAEERKRKAKDAGRNRVVAQ
jgi:diguanylate cyclase (GGDEF)-like protein